jgi:hypothetical protein
MDVEGLAKLLLTTTVSRPSLKPPAHNTPPTHREEREKQSCPELEM